MRRVSLLFSAVFLLPTFFLGQPVLALGPDAPALSGPQIDARLNALNLSLESQQKYAEYWEYGWGAFDGGTMLWSAVQARDDDNRKDRNTDIVQAAESLIGLADVVFRPLPAFSVKSLCEDPVLTKQDQLQCLTAREAMLKESAERAHEPYEMLPHLGNFGFNLLAGLIVWHVADSRHALITSVPGEIIGELQLWTTPAQPMADFDRYRLQFSPLLIETGRSREPAAGAMLTWRF